MATSVEKKLADLEALEQKEEKQIVTLRVIVIMIVVIGVLAGFVYLALFYFNSKSASTSQSRIKELTDKLAALESSGPDKKTGARITLTDPEIQAIVQLFCLVADGDQLLGSAVIYDKSGLLYTNKHVVSSLQGNIDPVNTACAVGVTTDTAADPEFKYIAVIKAYSKSTDVARMEIIGEIQGQNVVDLPAGKEFSTLKYGDSDPKALPPGSYVAIIGYPGIGGLTWNISEGIVSGRAQGFIKTDAVVAGGNSGGAALNLAKEYIGIPTFGIEQGAVSIDYIIPINDILSLSDWVTT